MDHKDFKNILKSHSVQNAQPLLHSKPAEFDEDVVIVDEDPASTSSLLVDALEDEDEVVFLEERKIDKSVEEIALADEKGRIWLEEEDGFQVIGPIYHSSDSWNGTKSGEDYLSRNDRGRDGLIKSKEDICSLRFVHDSETRQIKDLSSGDQMQQNTEFQSTVRPKSSSVPKSESSQRQMIFEWLCWALLMFTKILSFVGLIILSVPIFTVTYYHVRFGIDSWDEFLDEFCRILSHLLETFQEKFLEVWKIP